MFQLYKGRRYQERWFKCCECGYIQTAPKYKHTITALGHPKEMLCHNCLVDREFVQVDEMREAYERNTTESKSYPAGNMGYIQLR